MPCCFKITFFFKSNKIYKTPNLHVRQKQLVFSHIGNEIIQQFQMLVVFLLSAGLTFFCRSAGFGFTSVTQGSQGKTQSSFV